MITKVTMRSREGNGNGNLVPGPGCWNRGGSAEETNTSMLYMTSTEDTWRDQTPVPKTPAHRATPRSHLRCGAARDVLAYGPDMVPAAEHWSVRDAGAWLVPLLRSYFWTQTSGRDGWGSSPVVGGAWAFFHYLTIHLRRAGAGSGGSEKGEGAFLYTRHASGAGGQDDRAGLGRDVRFAVGALA
jgi:hypothetical protein